jgi:hypothetical protein
LFTSEVQGTDSAVLEKIQPKITHDMNEKLLAPFTPEEVRKVALVLEILKLLA